MKLTNRFWGILTLAAATLVLYACSADTQPETGTKDAPEIQLYLQTTDGPLLITSGALVGSLPQFEVRVVDRTRIESVEYQIDGGPWRDLEGHGYNRVNFIDGTRFSSDSATLGIRAVNVSGRTTLLTTDLQVDWIHPVIDEFTVNFESYVGIELPEFPLDADDEEEPVTRLELFAAASDEGAGSSEVIIELTVNGEVMQSNDTGIFDYVLHATALPDGLNRLQLTAIDGVGNRSDSISFAVRGGSL